nr:MAG TPA: hypothetical protein [Caudoviricetes sp.]
MYVAELLHFDNKKDPLTERLYPLTGLENL